jgi:hypothetical protein
MMDDAQGGPRIEIFSAGPAFRNDARGVTLASEARPELC